MIYSQGGRDDPAISQKMDPSSNHANLPYLPGRAFLTDTQVGTWEKRNKCELQQMRDVRLEMSVRK